MFILNKVKVSNNEVSVCIINLCEPTAQIALNTWCQTVFLLFALHEIQKHSPLTCCLNILFGSQSEETLGFLS